MQVDNTESLEVNNYKLFIATVNMLKYSQGFYSRIARDLDEMTSEQRQEIIDYFNSLDVKFKDTLDVVMFLEQ